MVIDRKENIKAANSVTFGLFYLPETNARKATNMELKVIDGTKEQKRAQR